MKLGRVARNVYLKTVISYNMLVETIKTQIKPWSQREQNVGEVIWAAVDFQANVFS